MKKTLQSISFLLAGMLIFSACTEEKTGKAPDKITDKIVEVDLEEVVQDTIPVDSVEIEEPVPPPPPPPPIPEPGPEPWPPEPEPWPGPYPEPEPLPPPPLPEPSPVPVNPILDFVDVEATFPGGVEEMMKFISKEMEYPQIDIEYGNQGRVFVEFVVEKDGSLTNLKVLRGVSPTIDKEALRVMRLMPKWEPGEVGGKIVRSKSRLPLTFKLD